MIGLHGARVAFAHTLTRLDDPEAARRASIANRDWFADVNHQAPDNPLIAMIHSLARSESDPAEDDAATVLAAFHQVSAGVRLPGSLELLLADQIARVFCETTEVEARIEARCRPDPEATSRRLLRLLETRRHAVSTTFAGPSPGWPPLAGHRSGSDPGPLVLTS